MLDYYELLDIPPDASEEEIRKAYRRKAKQYHPDVNKSKEASSRFLIIKKAYELLINRRKRFDYDQQRKESADTVLSYTEWKAVQQERIRLLEKKKQEEFLRRKANFQKSPYYFIAKPTLYLGTAFLFTVSIVTLLGCLLLMYRYTLVLFFFLLPIICGALILFKITNESFRNYKRYFINK